MKNLIDKNKVLSFLDNREGFYDFIEDLAKEYCDYNMTSFLEFAEKIIDGFSFAIQNMEADEEEKNAHCIISSYMPGDYPIYSYCCSECGESVESSHADEDFNFCAHCGAVYEQIVKYD